MAESAPLVEALRQGLRERGWVEGQNIAFENRTTVRHYSGLPDIAAERQGLRELGWVEGQNIIIDYRFAEGRFDRLAELAAEPVRLKVDVIAAGPTPPAIVAKNATGTIPIVINLKTARALRLTIPPSLLHRNG